MDICIESVKIKCAKVQATNHGNPMNRAAAPVHELQKHTATDGAEDW